MTARTSFEILKEQWGEYELEEGLVLKARLTLAFIHGDGTGLQFSTADQMFVHADDPKRGPPNKNSDSKTRTSQITNAITRRNPRSLYLLDDGSMVDIRQRPVAFHRTNAYGPDGAPIVDVQWSITINRIGAKQASD